MLIIIATTPTVLQAGTQRLVHRPTTVVREALHKAQAQQLRMKEEAEAVQRTTTHQLTTTLQHTIAHQHIAVHPIIVPVHLQAVVQEVQAVGVLAVQEAVLLVADDNYWLTKFS